MSDPIAAAQRLGDALRGLMDAAVRFDAESCGAGAADLLDEVTGEITALAGRLEKHQRTTMPWPDEDSMRRGLRDFSPLIGAANPLAPPLDVGEDPEGVAIGERAAVGHVTLRPIHEGPPGGVHGGWVASLLDQLLGHANAYSGVGGMTVELTVRYKRKTPYDVPLVLKARTDSVDGRRVHASGEIIADGVVTAEAEGLFLQPSPERIAAMREAAARG